MRGRRGPFGLVVQRAGAAEVAIDNSAVGRVPVAMRTDSGILENVLEVGMSALSGWISGYILGSVIGFGGGLVKGPGAAAGAEAASNAVKGRLGAARAAAGREAGKWAGISSTFSFFGTATRVVRRKEDKWNNVISSCGAGAQLNRGKGAQGMLNGCASYSIFTYFIEEFLSPAAKVGDDSAYTVKPNSEPAPSKSTKKGKASRQ